MAKRTTARTTDKIMVTPEVAALMRVQPRLTAEGALKKLDQLHAVGYVGRELTRALALIASYRTDANSLIRWRQDGLTLERIESCLSIQRDLGFCQYDSVAVIDWFLSDLNCVSGYEEATEEILGAFKDIFVNLTGRFSAQRLRHFIIDHCPNGVHEAYHLAIDDPATFVRMVNSSHSSRNEGRPMPDLAAVFDCYPDEIADCYSVLEGGQNG